MDPRVVKPKTPVRVIVTAVAIALIVLAFIVIAMWESGRGISDARMRGTVVSKEFVPEEERQITLGRDGGVNARDVDGQRMLTVEVTSSDGTSKTYTVWLNKERYDAVKVGDSFDVGAYLVK